MRPKNFISLSPTYLINHLLFQPYRYKLEILLSLVRMLFLTMLSIFLSLLIPRLSILPFPISPLSTLPFIHFPTLACPHVLLLANVSPPVQRPLKVPTYQRYLVLLCNGLFLLVLLVLPVGPALNTDAPMLARYRSLGAQLSSLTLIAHIASLIVLA